MGCEEGVSRCAKVTGLFHVIIKFISINLFLRCTGNTTLEVKTEKNNNENRTIRHVEQVHDIVQALNDFHLFFLQFPVFWIIVTAESVN